MTQPADKMPEEIYYSNQTVKNNGKEYMLHFTTLTETSENKTRYLRADLAAPAKQTEGDREKADAALKKIAAEFKDDDGYVPKDIGEWLTTISLALFNPEAALTTPPALETVTVEELAFKYTDPCRAINVIRDLADKYPNGLKIIKAAQSRDVSGGDK